MAHVGPPPGIMPGIRRGEKRQADSRMDSFGGLPARVHGGDASFGTQFHISRAIPGRTVLFRSLSRLRAFRTAPVCGTVTIAISLIPRGFLPIWAVRYEGKLTKISCGLGPATDLIQPRRGPPCSTARTSPTVRSVALPAMRRPEAPCTRRSYGDSMAHETTLRTHGKEANAENPNAGP